MKFLFSFTIRLSLAILLLLNSFWSSSQCNTNTSICSITGNTAGPFTFQNPSGNPSTCLDFMNGNSANYAYIVLYITETGNLDLLIQGNNGGNGCLDVAIFDITGQTNPCGSMSPATQISCNYVNPCVGCAEFGTANLGCPAVVNPGQVTAGSVIMILVEDWSDVQNSFTLTVGSGNNSAQTGIPDPTINPAGPFCATDGLMQLTAANMGGTWSGPGVSPSGMFNPAAVGPGTHTINYSIGVAPCNASSSTQITVGSIAVSDMNVGACTGGVYNVSGTVNISSPPSSGQLIVENCDGEQTVVATAPFSMGSYPFNLGGLIANGGGCDVHAYFTDSSCSHLLTYTAPACPPGCGFTNITATPTGCQAGNTYTLNGALSFVYPPSSGQLIVQDCNGNTQTFNAPFTSPVNYSINSLVPNGQSCAVTAHFTAEPSCTMTTSYVAPSIPVVTAGTDVTTCPGVSATLSASGATSYSWSPASYLNTTSGATVQFTPGESTTYTVTGTADNGCVGTATVSVFVELSPAINAGSDVVSCQGEQIILTANGAGNGGTYTWNYGVVNGFPFVPPAGTTVYTVTGVTSNGCTGTDSLTVAVSDNLDISFNVTQDQSCVPVQAVFENTSYVSGGNCVWTFDNGQTVNGCGSVTQTFSHPGVYGASLYMESPNGCSSTLYQDSVVIVDATPVASFTPQPVVFPISNPVVNFTNNSTGATSYVWDFGHLNASSTETSPSYTYPDEVDGYVVTLVAVSDGGCVDTFQYSVHSQEDLIFYIPNAFTPDGDEYNQTFLPVFTSGFDPYDYTLLIFNRWGETVFESHDVKVGWKGTYGADNNGNICQEGAYTWKIEFKVLVTDERKMYVGHVNLLR